MKILVKVKTGSKENKITSPEAKLFKTNDEYYSVNVKELPIRGRANDAVISLLSEYFKVPKSSISLKRGSSSKMKVFDIKGL